MEDLHRKARAFQNTVFDFEDAPDDMILICMGGGCIASGAQKIKERLSAVLEHNSLSADYRIIEAGCLGPCSKGPVLIIGADQTFYEGLSPADVDTIVEEHLMGGTVVESLVWKQHDGDSVMPVPLMKDIDFFRRQTKIVLRNCGRINPGSIDDYIALGGYQGLAAALQMSSGDEIIQEVSKSGLRGRGGAGFPTALKWSFGRKNQNDQKYMLCNADEGDPGAFMDRSILEGDPHSVIEGMAIGARAIGADRGYVYVRAEYPLAVERLRSAIAQAEEYGLLGDAVLGTDFSFTLEIRMGSGAFVCGEETALIASIEGKRGEPRPRPPFPAEKGLWGKPTVLNNVETYANIPLILSRGEEWFSSVGSRDSAGTKVFALAGDIAHSGLVEVPVGTSLGELVYDIGSGIPRGKEFKAAQIGGPSGGCVPRSHLNVPLDYEPLAELGAIMGSGGLVVMDEDTCMVDVARFFLEFVQEESCGKCVPCRVGTRRMLEILTKICEGEGETEDVERLIRLGKQIQDTALCGLGQTAPNPILSTIRHFRHEYDMHIQMKHCDAGTCPSLVRAPCQSACPAGVDVPGFVSLVSEKRYAEALRLHRERNPFAAVCARVCFHTCEDKCRRATLDAPVSIRGVKRFMVDQEVTIQQPECRENQENARRKIAVVGAGPAGLSCAYFLARLGYRPTVFEAAPRPGGMLVQTIPAYRLPRETLAREIRMIEHMGVDIITEQSLGHDFTLSSLREEGYDAVFIGIGAHKGIIPDIPGKDARNVTEACDFLKEYNIRGFAKVGRKVSIIGGGNAAIDAARTAIRLGGAVQVLYRRTKDEMPAYAEEVDAAVEEGVEILPLVNPVEILTEDGAVSGVKCQVMKQGDFDMSGRRRPEKSDEIFSLPADQIIFACGQNVDTEQAFSGAETVLGEGNTIAADERRGQTSVAWIFAGGDAVTGAASIVKAIASGERAAVGIDRYLTGEEHAFWREEKEIKTAFDPDSDPLPYKREKLHLLSVERRKNNFDEVEMSWTEGEAIRQAKRCLRCEYGK
jgi:NADH-quinone oxidoreductase subunit F